MSILLSGRFFLLFRENREIFREEKEKIDPVKIEFIFAIASDHVYDIYHSRGIYSMPSHTKRLPE